MVHGKAGDEARIVLAEFLKGRKAGLRVLPPLLLYGEDGEYTEEAAGILGTGDRAGNGGAGE
jgi:tRNA1Val (adenine37-N6)-methyltransferase